MTGVSSRPRRTYDEGCIAAHALDLVGDRWTLLVARELMLGPKRFGALRAGLPRISANILTQRLDEMVASGLLRRDVLQSPLTIQVYALTHAGQALWPVLRALCHWGAEQPGHDPGRFISPTSLMLSMRAMIAPAPADLRLTVGFRVDDETFHARLADGGYAVTAGTAPDADLRFAGPACGMAATFYGGVSLVQACAGQGVAFAGDAALGQRFVDLFSLRVAPRAA
jgi:DNA-binding HxlR family transcriptional regulator